MCIHPQQDDKDEALNDTEWVPKDMILTAN